MDIRGRIPGWYGDDLVTWLGLTQFFQNFGIVIGLGAGFFFALLVFTEFNTSIANETSSVLFKRGSKKTVVIKPGSSDEEALRLEEKLTLPVNEGNVEAGEKRQSAPTDIFSWQHINYTVPISGHEERKLLSDVSGYVAPGKLTALMGESGAGKTTLLNVLAERVNVGVVTGDKFVNGQGLPKDFQSQTYVLY
jgi:ATP-binding cassette subfamily G (WHITE) protein 2 (SNQ2)